MMSFFSRFRSSSVFDTGTSANGGQISGMVIPAAWETDDTAAHKEEQN